MNISKDIFEKIVEQYKTELKKTKTGRANASLIENIKAVAYGSEMRIQELASITVPEARQLVIKPYDARNTTKAIESALAKADLGCMPTVENDFIRLALPPLTEETRKKESAKLRKLLEEFKIKIRQHRHDLIKQSETEDDSKELQEKTRENIDKLVKEYNLILDEVCEAKTKEVETL